MNSETRLEKYANSFIDEYLADHPIMLYSLNEEVEEFLENVEELKDPKVKNNILQEYNNSAKKKGIDEEINNELINASEKVTFPSSSEDDFHLLNYDKLAYLQSEAGDPFMYDLIQLIVRNDKVRIRMMKEIIEAEQDDPYMPDEWIYHKDLKLSDVLKYIRNDLDDLRKEDSFNSYEPDE